MTSKNDKNRNLVVLTIQSDYLKKVVEQLEMIFGDLISIRPLQFNALTVERIYPNETVFSSTEGIIKIVKTLFPETDKFIQIKRSINLINTAEFMNISPGKRILVINDGKLNTDSTINELIESGFEHEYVPYSPGNQLPTDIDHVITCGGMDLVPQGITNVINLGFRVVSLESIIELSEHFDLGLSHMSLYKLHTKAMVLCSQKWATLKENKYISSWIGTRKEVTSEFKFSDMCTRSKAMKNLVFIARKMAMTDNPIHISGEPGVGKRRVAQAIHNDSNFSAGSFASVNCAARDQEMLEKELFGWEDAENIYPGLFETTARGTLCIEDIEHLSENLQSRLIRTLNERTFVRMNGSMFVGLNVRIITTSDDRIDVLHQEKRIQKELYYLLSPFTCHVPSLEERRDDFDEIVNKYLCNDLNKPDLVLEEKTVYLLKNHTWEGNIQELYNVLSQLVCLDEDRISPNLLPYYIKRTDVDSEVESAQTEEFNENELITEIEKSGFLEENLKILKIYHQGKMENKSFGRAVVQKLLQDNNIHLTKQQLRLRQERLNELGLLNVRIGRSGTTISKKGELFLNRVGNHL